MSNLPKNAVGIRGVSYSVFSRHFELVLSETNNNKIMVVVLASSGGKIRTDKVNEPEE